MFQELTYSNKYKYKYISTRSSKNSIVTSFVNKGKRNYIPRPVGFGS